MRLLHKRKRSLNLHMTKSSDRFVVNTKVVVHFVVNCELLNASRPKTTNILILMFKNVQKFQISLFAMLL